LTNNKYYLGTLSDDIKKALAEDRADNDITAQLIPNEQAAQASVISRQDAVVCGQPWVIETFRQVDADVNLSWHCSEGDEVVSDGLVFEATGPARSILTAERTALNFLQTLSYTASISRYYANLVKHTSVTLLDTRKTLPGLRRAQKYAVTVGGCANHRHDLNEAFLIKENHIAACGSIPAAIQTARSLYSDRRLEIEVENLVEFEQALAEKPDWIMLDNFSLEDLATAVERNAKQVKLEASGGIEDDNQLLAIAGTGVDYVSIGALTKHCHAIDLSMRLV